MFPLLKKKSNQADSIYNKIKLELKENDRALDKKHLKKFIQRRIDREDKYQNFKDHMEDSLIRKTLVEAALMDPNILSSPQKYDETCDRLTNLTLQHKMLMTSPDIRKAMIIGTLPRLHHKSAISKHESDTSEIASYSETISDRSNTETYSSTLSRSNSKNSVLQSLLTKKKKNLDWNEAASENNQNRLPLEEIFGGPGGIIIPVVGFGAPRTEMALNGFFKTRWDPTHTSSAFGSSPHDILLTDLQAVLPGRKVMKELMDIAPELSEVKIEMSNELHSSVLETIERSVNAPLFLRFGDDTNSIIVSTRSANEKEKTKTGTLNPEHVTLFKRASELLEENVPTIELYQGHLREKDNIKVGYGQAKIVKSSTKNKYLIFLNPHEIPHSERTEYEAYDIIKGADRVRLQWNSENESQYEAVKEAYEKSGNVFPSREESPLCDISFLWAEAGSGNVTVVPNDHEGKPLEKNPDNYVKIPEKDIPQAIVAPLHDTLVHEKYPQNIMSPAKALAEKIRFYQTEMNKFNDQESVNAINHRKNSIISMIAETTTSAPTSLLTDDVKPIDHKNCTMPTTMHRISARVNDSPQWFPITNESNPRKTCEGWYTRHDENYICFASEIQEFAIPFSLIPPKYELHKKWAEPSREGNENNLSAYIQQHAAYFSARETYDDLRLENEEREITSLMTFSRENAISRENAMQGGTLSFSLGFTK